MNYTVDLAAYERFVCSEQRQMIAHQLIAAEVEVLALSNALGGEVGELQNIVKKLISKDRFFNEDILHDQFVEEAGDVLWYLVRLLYRSGYTVETIMKANIAKLTARYDLEKTEGDSWRSSKRT